MKKQPDYADVKHAGAKYLAYFKGRYHGSFRSSDEAWESLWNGPIGNDLLAFQNEMAIKRAAHIAAEKRRKELESHETTA